MSMEDDFLADRKDVLKGQIEGIVKDLGGIEAQSRPQFPLRYFTGIFLPYFAGDEQRQYPQADVQMWIAKVAGSPFQEVDIVDDQTRQVLFTVPPMMDRGAIDLGSQSRGAPISHIVKSAQQLRHMSPRMGEQHLKVELTKKALVMKAPESVVQNLTVWNKIFERFGRPPMVVLDEQPAAAAKTEAGSSANPAILGGEMELL